MNYTEQQIIEKAKEVMKDLEGKYYTENCVKKAMFNEDEMLSLDNNKARPLWIISIRAIFDNIDFLHISDETGEPLYYQNFNTLVFDIEKNEEGEYFHVGIDLD